MWFRGKDTPTSGPLIYREITPTTYTITSETWGYAIRVSGTGSSPFFLAGYSTEALAETAVRDLLFKRPDVVSVTGDVIP